MFEGSADITVVRREKPAWIERLQKNGDLDRMLVDDANPNLHFSIPYAIHNWCGLTRDG